VSLKCETFNVKENTVFIMYPCYPSLKVDDGDSDLSNFDEGEGEDIDEPDQQGQQDLLDGADQDEAGNEEEQDADNI
jgi:hypothetical protein